MGDKKKNVFFGLQVRARTGEARPEEGAVERADDSAVVHRRGDGAPGAVRGHTHSETRGRRLRRPDAGGAADLRVREGPLHWQPALQERLPDRPDRRPRLRRRLLHRQSRQSLTSK